MTRKAWFRELSKKVQASGITFARRVYVNYVEQVSWRQSKYYRYMKVLFKLYNKAASLKFTFFIKAVSLSWVLIWDAFFYVFGEYFK